MYVPMFTKQSIHSNIYVNFRHLKVDFAYISIHKCLLKSYIFISRSEKVNIYSHKAYILPDIYEYQNSFVYTCLDWVRKKHSYKLFSTKENFISGFFTYKLTHTHKYRQVNYKQQLMNISRSLQIKFVKTQSIVRWEWSGKVMFYWTTNWRELYIIIWTLNSRFKYIIYIEKIFSIFGI